MKQFLMIVCCLVFTKGILLSSFRPVPETGGSLDTIALSGEWFLRPALPSDTATGKLPVLRFELRSRKFSGFSGCNQISGSFTTTADQLVFDKNIATTKIVCEGYNEKEFLANLLRVDHFRIKDSVLQLLIGQTPVSEWGRKSYIQKTL